MGFTPCLLLIFIYDTSFVARRVFSATNSTRGWGSRVFCAQGRIVFAPTLNANIWPGAVAFGVPIGLAPRVLDDVIFLPWRFNSYLNIA